jgi:glycosyltransferase involved in cell wall biosynthesis
MKFAPPTFETSAALREEEVRTRRKVLHIVGGMSRGGVETWLMHVTRNIDRNKFELHFFVNSDAECTYDPEILSLGGHIHYGGHPRNFLRYRQEFATVVRNHGPFTAVHSHVYWYSGIVAWLSYQAGIPIRIAHSHTAVGAPLWRPHRRMYQVLMRSLIMRYATHRIGVSHQAGEALFGRTPAKPFRLLHYGMDFKPFLTRESVVNGKRLLGIAPERRVIGHVGRFVPVKNHGFIVEFFARLVASGVDAHLVLVGDGPLAPGVKKQLEARGLSDRCTFAGSQSDVVPFFSAMDVFVLPSLWEGLPLVTLEAQAAGVPILASTAVPNEVTAIPSLVQRLSLDAGADGWASAISRILTEPSQRTGAEPTILQSGSFGLPACLEVLSGIYGEQLN